jgi:hypothetical protein
MQLSRNHFARDARSRTGGGSSLAWTLERATRVYEARVAIAGLAPERSLAGGRAGEAP